jgi:hypothetical protein
MEVFKLITIFILKYIIKIQKKLLLIMDAFRLLIEKNVG